MSALRDAMSHAALGWVKPELDETLRQARGEIEAFAEDPADTSRMRFCAGYLHQVQGTLRMVELYAPAMVAEEMELLAQVLQQGATDDRDEACATLMRGTVLLPDYLERLQNGHRDIPIVLLPLLNDLRAARGAAGLNENVLFAPDLTRPLPEQVAEAAPLPSGERQDQQALARDRFAQTLADWPEHGVPADPEALAAVAASLFDSARHDTTRRMLWVLSSAAEALRDGALQANDALRSAFLGISRALRQAHDDDMGADAAIGVPSQEPTRQLLYVVAQARTAHPALEALRRAFDLDAAAPSQAELDHARGSLSGRNRDLLNTVGGVVKEELLRVKDALDLHLRTGGDAAGLQPQVAELTNVADTLGMLGLGVAREVVLTQRDSLAAIAAGVQPASEGALLDIAGALLYVDASLDDQVSRLGAPGEEAVDDAAMIEARRTMEVLAHEAIANFAAAREHFVAFIETNWDHARLVEVPRLLSEVSGALRILDLATPADYLEGVRRYVATELLQRRRVPSGSQLDTLADAMASLEYYLEALRDRRPNRDDILEITRTSLESLHYWPLPELLMAPAIDDAAAGEPSIAAVPIALAQSAAGPWDPVAAEHDSPVDPHDEAGAAPSWPEQDEPSAADPVAVMQATAVGDAGSWVNQDTRSVADTRPAPVVQGQVGPIELGPESASVMAEVSAAAAGLGIAAGVAPDAAAAPVPDIGGFDAAVDIDSDIREVFLEEFEEERANLERMLPHWRAVPEDLERSRPIRRVFHTLKGSGRLVGARALGEFSWKIEGVLNRVLDGTRAPTPAVLALVQQACEVLPQFDAALRGHGRVTADLYAMEALADRIAAGEEAFFAPAATAADDRISVEEAAVDEAVVAVAAAGGGVAAEPMVEYGEGTPASVDSVLREILEAEVALHLETVDAWLAAARQLATPASEALLRAIHTMNGAFAMTDVPEITTVTTPAETFVRRSLAAEQAPGADGVEALAGMAAAIRACMKALQAESPRIPGFAVLAERLQALADSLPEGRWLHAVEPSETIEAVDEADAGDEIEQAGGVDPDDVAAAVGEADVVATTDEFAGSAPADRALAAAVAGVVAGGVIVGADAIPAALPPEAAQAQIEAPADGMAEVDATAVAQATGGTQADDAEAVAGLDEATGVEALEQGAAEPESSAAEEFEPEAPEPEPEPEPESESESESESGTGGDDIAATTDAIEMPALGMPLPESRPAEEIVADGPMLDFNELDRDLVDIFVEEGVDLLDHVDGLLQELRADPGAREPIVGLQRDLHTIKGGARMAGIATIGDLGHVIESLLEAVAEQRTELGRGDIQLLERGFDTLHRLLQQTRAHRVTAMPQALIEEFEARIRGDLAPVDADADVDVDVDAEATAAADGVAASAAAAEAALPVPAEPRVMPAPLSAPIDDEDASVPAADEGAPRTTQEQVRVRADLLDNLVNHAGEVAIYRSRLEQQLGAFRSAMSELDRTNARLRDQLRRLDLETEAQIVARYQREQDSVDPTFDPLELDRFSTLQQLSRALNESSADLVGLQGVLDDLARQYDILLQQQSRVSSDLQDGLMSARMVPFDSIVPRLRRVVRQAATETRKQVQLKLEGAHGELDRNVLDRMVAPLEHMLRNSVAHGLELPKERRAAGKGEEGTITIALRREGSEIVLQVADDGRGLDRAAIRRRAEQRGLVKPGAELGDAELDSVIFESGFSTSDKVSQLSGRGVGMDVVRNEVRQLGGSVDIESQAGKGANFTLRLPQTLAVTQAVFVRIGDTTYAVPVASVGGIGRIARERFEAGGDVYRYAGEEYALHDLGVLVGQGAAKAEGQAQVPLLLVRAGDLRAAVAIDQVVGNREIVVKPVGLQVSSVPGIYGATITGEGQVVVILDVAPLVRRHLAQPERPVAVEAPQARHVPLVMVVDDSLTMRKVTGRVLERHNFEVVVARDGVEALEKLEDRVPDLMLLDIEMPRMDGYELATVMRADDRFRAVPIVMITSRSGEKHRQRAFEIGVQRYLGKPYQELDLMRNVYDLLGIARVRG